MRSTDGRKCDAGSSTGDGGHGSTYDNSDDVGGGTAASAAGAIAGSGSGKRSIDDFSVEEVHDLVLGMGISLSDAAEAVRENDIDGKTLASADFNEFPGMREA